MRCRAARLQLGSVWALAVERRGDAAGWCLVVVRAAWPRQRRSAPPPARPSLPQRLPLFPYASARPAESKELLTYCIKRVRGLQKVKLVDAAFVWTEPHRCALPCTVLASAPAATFGISGGRRCQPARAGAAAGAAGCNTRLRSAARTPRSPRLTPTPAKRSMRLKAKLTIQGEVLNGAILQQSFVVE